MFAAPVFGETIALDKFGYLNNNESSVIIDPSDAQDLLNVDITPGGGSVKKRAGYGLYKQLSGDGAIHGGHHFFDSSGNDVQVWGSSRSLYGIVADASPTQIISSATVGTTWDCADTQGFAYCVTSSRDLLTKTNGATQSWFTSPLGTMIAVTPDRLIVSGVAASPNTLHFSESQNFTNFTPGITATSPFAEVIAAPGSRITHVEAACGRVLWWKDQSFGYLLGTDQTNIEVVTVSGIVGTQDNSSAIDNGGNVWFRGSDGHIYRYDCASLEKTSIEISPNIQQSGSRTANSYSESTQSDFQSGTISPTGQLSTTVSPGDITPSSFTTTITLSSDFATGTFSNAQISGNSIVISTNNGNVTNNSFESLLSNWTTSGNWVSDDGLTCGASGSSAQDGTRWASWADGSLSGTSVTAYLIDGNDSSILVTGPTISHNGTNSCSWTQRAITGNSTYARKYAKVRFTASDGDTLTSAAFIYNGRDIAFYSATFDNDINSTLIEIDNVTDGVSSLSTGTFTSTAYNTGLLRSYVSLIYTATVNDFTPAFTLHDAAASGGPWAEIGQGSGQSYSARQYVRFISSFTVSGSSDAATSLDDVTLLSRSSGTYYSPVINRPSLTTWDTLNVSASAGNGSHTYYIRSSTNTFTVLSSTPSWTSQSAGSAITASTGTHFQFRDDFGVTGSTHTPTLSEFTINWFEGTASDKAYASYFNDAVWWSVSFGDGQTTNNYIFKYDLLNSGWTIYDFGAGGFLVQGNRLYFGSTADSGLYRYGSSTDDNGSAINAYWKSKDFPGQDPWLENEYTNIDTIIRRDPSQTLSVDYALNASTTTTSFDIGLSNTTQAVIRHKKLLPAGKIGGLFNIMFSDESTTSAWEVLGFRFTYKPLPYRPSQ